jgi:hypothetical protein
MAKNIDLDQFGGLLKERVNQIVSVIVLEADAELKARSPVDTGRFRSSWAIGQNQAGSYDGGAKQPATGANRGKSEPPSAPLPGPPVGINYAPQSEKVGNAYHIFNSLPYAEALANGHSTQAPAGWVDLVGKAIEKRAKQIADSELRKL